MKHGFVKVAAATPIVKVADVIYNGNRIMELIDKAEDEKAKLIVLPELCVTGYTCGDLFFQDTLIIRAEDEIKVIAKHTIGKEVIAVIGFPYSYNGKLYNTAAVIKGGKVIGLVPKTNLPNYKEFYELRYFTPGIIDPALVEFQGDNIYFGSKILFRCSNMMEFTFGVEICEDLWVSNSPSISHCEAGALIIANLSASDETVGKSDYRRDLVRIQSDKQVCGYIYANGGEGESTTDMVFAGNNLISESGKILIEAPTYDNGIIISEIDVSKLGNERRKMNTYSNLETGSYIISEFEVTMEKDELPETILTRTIDPSPFVPSDKAIRNRRCQDIINIQAQGLKTRISHIGIKNVIIGLSGGLDSTLAVMIADKAFDLLDLDKSGIIGVTMPCFGTTDRTYNNSISLAKGLGITLKEIPIKEAVELHFKDIGQDIDNHDITYENSQARERTQVLMDLANMYNGIVIGTGDLSELALGWATYNGDHMSMYGVNCSVPKTLVRHLVAYLAFETKDNELQRVLYDVLDTPVSPELLPPEDGKIAQVTEDIVGPYELHDFFLYNIIRYGFSPAKVYKLAKIAFTDKYKEEIILKWLNTFYRRFFSQQFKRSSLPDGPKVGSVSLSPRSDWRMPSDASATIWLEELKNIL
ncbi:MAG: NAD(+) synthase [Clostridiales bacterium]|nr:NAD(+) synthase [Clostridiales bacterium]